MPLRTRSADELLPAVGAGDQRAFATLCDRVGSLVYANVWRVLRDEVRAEAVAEETLAEVWRRAERFDASEAPAVCWILDLAHQIATERARDDDARGAAGSGSDRGGALSPLFPPRTEGADA